MDDGHAAQARSCWRHRGVLQVCNAHHIPDTVPPLVALAIVSAWSLRESSAQRTISPSPDLSTANPTKEDFAKQIDIGGGPFWNPATTTRPSLGVLAMSPGDSIRLHPTRS
jgi:hypothetical protein